MYIRCFLSEYSIPSKCDIEIILKAHLLSNKNIIVPAATVGKTEIHEVLHKRMDILAGSCIKIAHGSDVNSLTNYPEKYPEIEFKDKVLEVYKYFSETGSVSIYNPKQTIEKFNRLMRMCAEGELRSFSDLFGSKELCENIINYDGLFNLGQYFEILRKSVHDQKTLTKLESHAKYFYNYFGSRSIGADNTFSIENYKNFDFIKKELKLFKDLENTGIGLIISVILDLDISNKKRYNLDNIDFELLKKLSFSDIIDIREIWLHSNFLKYYDDLVRKCIKAYTEGLNDIESAIVHLNKSVEIRENIFMEIKSKVKSEILAYNIFRILQAMGKPVASLFIDLLAPWVSTAVQITSGIYSEIVDMKPEYNILEKMKMSKINRLQAAIFAAENINEKISAIHPTLSFLKKLKEYDN